MWRYHRQDRFHESTSGLPDLSWYMIPKGHKISKMADKYINIFQSKKITQIGMFWLQINHLATLVYTCPHSKTPSLF
jgi:hypothetical protein